MLASPLSSITGAVTRNTRNPFVSLCQALRV